MERKISFTIEEDIYEKFCLALNLTKEEEPKVVENCLKWYIAKTFEKVSQEYEPETSGKQEVKQKAKFYAKAAKKIPVWARRPEQYCHKIIREFFLCEQQRGKVIVDELEAVCSDEAVPELFVPTFRSNYAQMKIDTAKTYSKVFEDDGTTVSIWSEVKEVLMEYKSYFCE